MRTHRAQTMFSLDTDAKTRAPITMSPKQPTQIMQSFVTKPIHGMKRGRYTERQATEQHTANGRMSCCEQAPPQLFIICVCIFPIIANNSAEALSINARINGNRNLFAKELNA